MAYDPESSLPDFAVDRRKRHVVVALFHRPARSPVNDDQAAARAKRARRVVEHRSRIVELVIRVADQYCVCCRRWQARVFFPCGNDVNVGLTPQKCPGPQEKQRQLPKIYREDLTSLANGGSELEREVTGSRAQVDYGVSLAQIQGPENIKGALPLVAFGFHYVETIESICEGVKRAESQEDQNNANQEQAESEKRPAR